MRLLLFISILGIPFKGLLQSPSYFKLGEKELAGLDVYTLLQDSSDNYWIGTRTGLIKYDGYEFELKECAGFEGRSIFNLKMDRMGDVYCNLVSGQILKIEKDSLTLFYGNEDEKLYPGLDYTFSRKNELILVTNRFYRERKGKFEKHYTDQTTAANARVDVNGDPKILTNHGVWLTIKEDGSFSGQDKPAQNKEPNLRYGLSYIVFDKKVYVFQKILNKLISVDGRIPSQEEIHVWGSDMKTRGSIFKSEESLWYAPEIGGLKKVGTQESILYFEDVVFSAATIDHEGNYILGTLGNGILIKKLLDLKSHK